MVSRETGFTLQSFLLFIDINSYDALKKYISLGRLVMSRKAEKKPLKFHGYFFLIGNILRTQNTGRTSEHPLL